MLQKSINSIRFYVEAWKLKSTSYKCCEVSLGPKNRASETKNRINKLSTEFPRHVRFLSQRSMKCGQMVAKRFPWVLSTFLLTNCEADGFLFSSLFISGGTNKSWAHERRQSSPRNPSKKWSCEHHEWIGGELKCNSSHS